MPDKDVAIIQIGGEAEGVLADLRRLEKGLDPNDFIDSSILKTIEDSGFVKNLYGK